MMTMVGAGSLYDSLGKRIAAARKKKGWGQSKLAKSCGLTRGSIANIELGRQRAPLETLWRIGLALSIEPRDLVPALRDLQLREMPGDKRLEAKFVPPTYTNEPRVKAFILGALGETEEPSHGSAKTSNRALSGRASSPGRHQTSARRR